jgi:hypothetical protein
MSFTLPPTTQGPSIEGDAPARNDSWSLIEHSAYSLTMHNIDLNEMGQRAFLPV